MPIRSPLPGRINTAGLDDPPFVAPDGRYFFFSPLASVPAEGQLFHAVTGIWVAIPAEAGWSEPELIVERFAGEATLDARGNLYSVHHYFRDGEMIETDIHVAIRRH